MNPEKCSFGVISGKFCKLLLRPEVDESLQLYLAISDAAVSSVLVREAEWAQKPIYYVSHVLRGAEDRTRIKAQALADFVIECTSKAPPKIQAQAEEEANSFEFEWSMHVDGARNDKRSGASLGFLLSIFCGRRMRKWIDYPGWLPRIAVTYLRDYM
ncbi:hypothetical protein LIER_26919 [Lithospermum erythrorhizon]|uniref:Uncharacterized protein n=1 Tax=Lithospermum erythrorhizon TaxID=34254 RepID=A0AAV3RA39_LITER